MMMLWLGSVVVGAVVSNERSDPQSVRTIVPLALLGICLITAMTSGKQKSVYFSPAEVNFLFSGPFSRRELLAYKISGGAMAATFSALFLSVVLARHGTWWIAVFLGCLLSLWFIQFFSTAVMLISQTIAEHAYSRVRRLVLLGVLILVAAAAGPALAGGLDQGVLTAVKAFGDSTVGFWLLVPFEPFGRTIAAEHLFGDLIGWATLAMAIDLAMLGLVMRLDVNYLEAAVAISQKLYKQRQQARRRGTAWVAQGGAGWRLPRFPWLGGAGPIARRQLTTAIRAARGFLVLLLIMSVFIGGALFSFGKESGHTALVALGSQVLMFTIIFARLFPFDFRGDMDNLETVKSLPLGSVAITVGQLATPVLLMTAIHLVLLVIVGAATPTSPVLLLAIALFTLPFNFLLFAVENLFFLLFPARTMAATPGDLQHIGRAMVEMFAKIITLAVCCGAAAGFGFLGYLIAGQSPVVFVAVAWLSLAIAAGMTVPCVAWAYRKFDVSLDTPA